MRSGASVTIVRTTASSQRPPPASSVSRTCSSNESSSLVTHAIPPCAQAVFVSAPLRFVMTATDPCRAAFNAKLRPAMPLPITAKSYSFITVKQAISPPGVAYSNTQTGLSASLGIHSSQPNIIYQTSLTEEHSQHEHRIRSNSFNRHEIFRINNLNIIDPRQGRFVNQIPHKSDNACCRFGAGISSRLHR